MAARPGAVLGCGVCELSRARGSLERAVAELRDACRAWGVWAGGIRQLAEQRLGVSDFLDERVVDDPGYGRALDLGTPLYQAVTVAEAALRTVRDGADAGAGGSAGCRCAAVKAQIGSPHP
jgi:hypothetical protein